MYPDHSAKIDLRKDVHFFRLLSGSYQRFVGNPLTPRDMSLQEAVRWLYEDAPFAILAHDTGLEPIFIYGNKAAQRQFEYEWDELTSLPSRLSAQAPEREERDRFLQQVKRDGYVVGYSGIRIAKSGRRFRIENATVWQLIDDKDVVHGQAAMILRAIDL